MSEAFVERLLRAYPQLSDPELQPKSGGLLHQTFALEDASGSFIFQRVNSVFAPEIHENIRMATRCLLDAGLTTLLLEPALDGQYYWRDNGAIYRLMTCVPGRAYEVCETESAARSAAGLVARFHGALAPLDAPLHDMGFPYRIPQISFDALSRAIETKSDHPFLREVVPLARRVANARADWPERSRLPERVIHGDLKFNNLLFQTGTEPHSGPEAISIIDLDTICRRPLYHDLGDAWRSWCNRNPEDQPEANFDLSIFEAAAHGYLAELTLPLETDERDSVTEGVERVSVELAARFATDALEESYFAWDPGRFERSGLHQLNRARGQLDLYDQARDHRAEIGACLSD